VLIKVAACGICHSDVFTKEGLAPGMKFPRVPGHEVMGHVAKVGANVTRFREGQPVGVGWNGGYCRVCEPCREGYFQFCVTSPVTGLTYDGGYGEYMVAPQEAVALAPDGLDLVQAAPLVCAGITTFNALRNAGARPGDLVAVQGIGGLGHLGVQFAHHSGFRTVAISRGMDKEAFARELGADHYVDDSKGDAAAQLQKLGGAKVILATAPNADAISALAGGLKYLGKLLVLAAPQESLKFQALPLIFGSRSVSGWYSGHAHDSEDTLAFSQLTGVRAMVETYPLAKVEEAYARMLSNKARFRVVLTMP
jgi:D-arabinose 1-dehydrogenase-like Zn-dependent alcohol dehydrogenase